MEAVQISQNKMLRMLDRVSLKEHVTTASLLEKYNIPSVNQLAAEIKLVEAWKCQNVEQYPLKLEPNNPNKNGSDRVIRTSSIKMWKDDAKTMAAKVSFSRDCARLWNNCPVSITQATTLNLAKKEIKKFCCTLVL